MLSAILGIASVLLVVLFLRSIFSITTVHGGSMYPTLDEGDRLLTFNFFPGFFLRRGQIVVGMMDALHSSSLTEITLPDNLTELGHGSDINLSPILEPADELEMVPRILEPDCAKFIKRITGLPGDTVCIPFSSLHEFMQTILKAQQRTDDDLVWVVPDRHCFVQGDSPVCIDSLTAGPIPIAALTGIVVLKLPRREPIGIMQSSL